MKQEYRDAWVAALRSGEYKQGINALIHNGAYCCLGVLGDLAVKNQWFPELNVNWRTANFYTELAVDKDSRMGSLPNKLTSKLDISIECQSALVVLNDVERRSFEQIADYIETNLKDI